ncbi:MAG: serine hydrolase domain-containing protein [Wenzhouxiangella sp.]|nr:serine hydrolase domain-containing protein [Wenzhouxiangella sp.]
MTKLLPLMALALATGLSAAADTQMHWRERFQSVTPTNFDQGGAVSHQFHLHAESYLTMATVTAPSSARALSVDPSQSLADLRVRHRNGEDPFARYVAAEPWISSVIVLHGGEVVFEAYPRMPPNQRHFAWSVGKVVTSAVIAALVHDGLVDMDKTVAEYVPALAESEWAGLTLTDVANMASGIDCLDSDGYQNPATCVYRMEETLGITADRGYDKGFMAHLAGMGRRGPPGEIFEYVSANTNVLGLVAEVASGQPFAALLSEQIWRPIGAESDALMAISDEGFSYYSGGLTARLRDIARFGEIFVSPERFGVLGPTLVDAMQHGEGVPFSDDRQQRHERAFGEDVPRHAGWQWDMIWDDGGMYKGGYLGQGLYVDPERDLVIAWFGTGEDFSAKQNEMPAVSRQIARAGLFDD